MTETGRAVLDRMTDAPGQSLFEELYDSFADRPSLADMFARLGIEKITAALLDQRYTEDLDAIAALPRAEVI